MGCPKNLVDSEAATTMLKRAGCSFTDDPREAELLIVSACSFLGSAWRETVDEVERLSEHKRRGAGRWLVLMGCLPRHSGENLESSLPGVDFFLPAGAHGLLPELVATWTSKRNGTPRTADATDVDRFAGFEDRELLTPPHTAYVKVAEGCNRACSFCAIPTIKGRQVTRPLRSVLAEVGGLVERGVREVTLLSQDLASYDDDGRRYVDLVDAIAGTGIPWIRLLYLHPAGLRVDDVRRLFEHPSVVRYLDIPIQHASTRVLGRMRRSHDRAYLERLISAIRSDYPEVVLRSEVVVGFPGETDEEFDELLTFVREFEFDSLGVFPYSREPGTAAADFGDALPEAVVKGRAEELASAQEAVSFGIQSGRLGKVYKVLVDRKLNRNEGVFGGCRFAGRYYGQALDVDGEVYLRRSGGDIRVGEFVSVRITETGIFDLKGELLK